MKKLINAIDDILSESLEGFGAAHSDILRVNLDPKFVARVDAPIAGQVALLSGGGSGHEPLHAGFVGKGMLTAACPGEVFTSPTPDQMVAAAAAVNGDGGVLFIVKNYAGDVMNFEMAAEMAADMGIEVATVLTNDDVAVEDSTYTQGRRGVAGTVIVEKIVGAAAEAGLDLAGCKTLGDRVNGATGTMGVALTSCTVPAAGSPTFDLGDDEMEMGVGIHGEPGRQRLALQPAADIAQTMVDAICESIGPASGDRVLLMVNGMGGTPQMELYLIYRSAAELCRMRGLEIARSVVGNYCTSLEMQGCSITLTKLDDEMLGLWDAPVRTAAFNW
jgi:dihydroxyacetone kinase-like protein